MSAPALWPSGPSLTDLAPADGLPAAPRRIRIGMPQLDVGGLSEGWLYRTCGDLHWEEIGRELGVSSDGFRAEAGQRLYPTVVALRARYGAPLAAVEENDLLAAKVLVRPCGRACAHGRIDLTIAGRRSSVELLTTFAVHQPGGGLRMAIPAPELAERWLVETPKAGDPSVELVRLAKAARAGIALDDDFCGPSLRTAEAALGRFEYEPSPYADYNGAGLLYFAAYVTIADTAERALVRRLGLSPRPRTDWALATSTVRRAVFFYANLTLGEPLVVDLLRFELSGARSVKTHLRLSRPRRRPDHGGSRSRSADSCGDGGRERRRGFVARAAVGGDLHLLDGAARQRRARSRARRRAARRRMRRHALRARQGRTRLLSSAASRAPPGAGGARPRRPRRRWSGSARTSWRSFWLARDRRTTSITRKTA